MSKPMSAVAEFEARIQAEKQHRIAHELAAYIEGRELARRLFETLARYRAPLAAEDRVIGAAIHHLDKNFAHGFIQAFTGALKSVLDLIPKEDREDLAFYLAEDIRDHAETALSDLGQEWVSPWMLYADKLRDDGPNGLKLQLLTIGLFREFEAFDCGRCLTGLDEDFRIAALAMLESFSRHGRNDPHFANVAQTLQRYESLCPGWRSMN